MAAPSVLLKREISESTLITAPQRGALNLMERLAAGIAFAAAAPALGATMLAVRALSGRSPLIAHRRLGRNGEPFWILKIRTMWDRPAPPGGPT